MPKTKTRRKSNLILYVFHINYVNFYGVRTTHLSWRVHGTSDLASVAKLLLHETKTITNSRSGDQSSRNKIYNYVLMKASD